MCAKTCSRWPFRACQSSTPSGGRPRRRTRITASSSSSEQSPSRCRTSSARRRPSSGSGLSRTGPRIKAPPTFSWPSWTRRWSRPSWPSATSCTRPARGPDRRTLSGTTVTTSWPSSSSSVATTMTWRKVRAWPGGRSLELNDEGCGFEFDYNMRKTFWVTLLSFCLISRFLNVPSG